MRAKPIAEHAIRTWMSNQFPGLDARLDFTGAREAIITDVNGDHFQVVYDGGEVRMVDA